jgi:hypothetical protein
MPERVIVFLVYQCTGAAECDAVHQDLITEIRADDFAHTRADVSGLCVTVRRDRSPGIEFRADFSRKLLILWWAVQGLNL